MQHAAKDHGMGSVWGFDVYPLAPSASHSQALYPRRAPIICFVVPWAVLRFQVRYSRGGPGSDESEAFRHGQGFA